MEKQDKKIKKNKKRTFLMVRTDKELDSKLTSIKEKTGMTNESQIVRLGIAELYNKYNNN